VSHVRFVVYSDYLCPWCYNASVRLRAIEAEYAGAVELEWRSYLLRPEPRTFPDRAAALEKFRGYTESWRRPAEEPDAGRFTVWSSDEGPPSHSVPAHRVAKAAGALGAEAFGLMHERLLRAYFGENRDISRFDVARTLWEEVGLPAEAFAVAELPETADRVRAEHRQALAEGATGVPAIRLSDNPAMIVGAHPIELYRRWVDRTLERRAAGGA